VVAVVRVRVLDKRLHLVGVVVVAALLRKGFGLNFQLLKLQVMYQ
jgi:hypothetical protein